MKTVLKNLRLGAAAVAATIMLVGSSANFAALAQAAPPAVTSGALSDGTIRALQDALNKQGVAVKVDGILTDETRAAIRKYQSQHHLPVTGEPDKATLDKLGVRLSAAPTQSSTLAQAVTPPAGTPPAQAPPQQAPMQPGQMPSGMMNCPMMPGMMQGQMMQMMQGMMQMMQMMQTQMQMMQGMMQPGQMPGQMQPGQMPRQMQPGQMQPGQMQPGQMPRQMQPGQMQPGQMQPGQMQPGPR